MRFEELETPCYVIDEKKLKHNLTILSRLEKDTGCHILLAQKAFSYYPAYPLIGQYISGTTASGLFEAKLGYEELKLKVENKENHVFCPGYKACEMDELDEICDHLIFNSLTQYEKLHGYCKKSSVGLRINPECSTQDGHAIYDPCAPFSRLGIRVDELKQKFGKKLPKDIEGMHFHTLCEQNSDDLDKTLSVVEEKFQDYLKQIKWINFGGGHHITRCDYDLELLKKCIVRMQEKYGVNVYLEPGEAIALNAGYFVTQVVDVVHNEMDILILDGSAACHMPDVLEMPYRPPLKNSGEVGEKKYLYRLASSTCLAGDIIGDYSFDKEIKIGDKLVFEDMAIYSMVKNNTFNGMPLPDIVYMNECGECHIQKAFCYSDFKHRLG
ncbi:MAG: carboxynorspermidine decarboxylase [Lachnospiraceae bacterium]|nr:carboxynorspermidine decarboxylase [Lachnospiraceae bacterium]